MNGNVIFDTIVNASQKDPIQTIDDLRREFMNKRSSHKKSNNVNVG